MCVHIATTKGILTSTIMVMYLNTLYSILVKHWSIELLLSVNTLDRVCGGASKSCERLPLPQWVEKLTWLNTVPHTHTMVKTNTALDDLICNGKVKQNPINYYYKALDLSYKYMIEFVNMQSATGTHKLKCCCGGDHYTTLTSVKCSRPNIAFNTHTTELIDILYKIHAEI